MNLALFAQGKAEMSAMLIVVVVVCTTGRCGTTRPS